MGVKVSYKLDGKDISAKELQGKSGKVEINIQYMNHSEETVKLNKSEKRVKMYTPFTMVTAMMLSTDEYTNVEVDNRSRSWFSGASKEFGSRRDRIRC